MKKPSHLKIARGGKHSQPKPRLRTRKFSTTGKSAYGSPPGAPAFPAALGGDGPAFPTAPVMGAGAPAGPVPGAGGADSAPLEGPGGPGMPGG